MFEQEDERFNQSNVYEPENDTYQSLWWVKVVLTYQNASKHYRDRH